MNEKRRPKILQILPMQTLVTVGILFVLFITLSFISKEFFTSTNLLNVTRQVATVVITGSAVTLLMISGNMDLSVGSIFALAGVLAAKFAVAGIPIPVCILLAMLIGGFCGLISGICVTKLHVTPVIATLGVMYVARGLALIFCEGRTVNLGLPANYADLGRTLIAGKIPIMLVITIVIVAIFLFIQNKTLIGKYAYAIGGNPVASVLSGINADLIILTLFILSGMLAAFSGVLMGSRLGVGDPNVGVGFEFDVIVAIVLGGTSLRGGEGSIFGMIIGALIVGFLGNGLNLLDVQSFYQDVLKGVVLVLAVIADAAFKRRIR